MQLACASNCLNAMYFLAWIMCTLVKDLTYLDCCWGLGFMAQSLIYYSKSVEFSFWDMIKTFSTHPQKMSFEKLTFIFIICAHSLRQMSYLLFRKGSDEDVRYKEFRNRVGQQAWWLSYFTKFLPQVFANLVIGLVIYEFNNSSHANINHLSYWIGIGTMIFGSLFEAVADVQLYNFKNSTRMEGKIQNTGLWGLCRHPNYFGEILFFTGAFICNYSIGKYYTIICPIVEYIMLRYITGVPVLEKYLLERNGQRYQEYIDSTPCLCPMAFPISGKSKEIEEKVTPQERSIPHIPTKATKAQ
jgi:steroid 5-alpha reductase family enzyme